VQAQPTPLQPEERALDFLIVAVLSCGRMANGVRQRHPEEAGDRFAAALRGFGPLGVLAISLILAGNAVVTPLSAVLVLVWAWLSRTPWREIGFTRPRNWTQTLAIGIAVGVALKLLMKAMVMPLVGAPEINPAFHYLVGNSAALPGMLYAVLIGAAFGEETIFRGYAFERLGKILGDSARAKAGIVLVTAAWFGAEHYSLQGLPGVEQAIIVGLIFGAIFAQTRQIWLVICMHAAFDLTAVAIIYRNLESAVAHFFFK
jgi:membrane protease YdiL (CAAX protease family)